MKLEEAEELVKVEDLVLRFYTYDGVVQALDRVNLKIFPGETLGLVGETGCGKSVTSLSLLGIVLPPGVIEAGKIMIEHDGKKVNTLERKEDFLRRIRGKDISMVFQEPRGYLNPVYTVEVQIAEVIMQHRKKEFIEKTLEGLKEEYKKRKGGFRKKILKFYISIYERMAKNVNSLSVRFLAKIPIVRRFQNRLKKEIREEVIKLLRDMQIGDPERVSRMYPHELSGGMAQRVVIAMALACKPKLIICDEPTTNLDVTVQAQILELLTTLKKDFKSAVLYITHDLGVVAQICDRVAVMYAGTVVEMADIFELFRSPLHPYTRGLLESIPRPRKEFKSIPGVVPSLINPPSGCRFHDRCWYAKDICRRFKPPFLDVKNGHHVACHLYANHLGSKE